MSFQTATRRFTYPMETQSKVAGDTGGKTLRWRLDKNGILAGIYLTIRGTVAGTPSTPNALGKSNILKDVRLVLNGKIDVIRLTGPQYHYLVRDNLEQYIDAVSYSDGRSAVASGAFNLDMFLPLAVNSRDVPGLLNLQADEMEAILSVEFDADTALANDLTSVTATVIPTLEFFTVPPSDDDLPPLNVVHAINGESRAISAAGDAEYFWPRGNTYLALYHAMGIGVSGADAWSRLVVKATGNQNLMDVTPNALDGEFTRFRGRARPKGVIPIDLLGTSGLGTFGSIRDALYSQGITNLKSVLTATGATTLHSVRRELIAIEP